MRVLGERYLANVGLQSHLMGFFSEEKKGKHNVGQCTCSQIGGLLLASFFAAKTFPN